MIADLWNVGTVIGVIVIVWIASKFLCSFYYRILLSPRNVLSYGKWAIVTGCTSGIGEAFSKDLARKGMSVLLISRSESKLLRLQQSLAFEFSKQKFDYIVYDYSESCSTKNNEFRKNLIDQCEIMNNDGGIGVLVNNVGTSNEVPRRIYEFTKNDIQIMLNCNLRSLLIMTKCILYFMKLKHKGLVINISSGSGNHMSPFLSLYSSTKAFMNQFSRSLTFEYQKFGIEFKVITPFYIVSNLYKRRSGSLIAPMPETLISGILQLIGKTNIYETHG